MKLKSLFNTCLAFCLAFLFLGLFMPRTSMAWWDGSWTKRSKLTFNNSDQSENLQNFPVLIKLDSSRINYAATQDQGQDIRFVDSNDTDVLPHEIEMWDEAGTSYVWVKVPQIDGSSDTDYIWMYYGNSGASDVRMQPSFGTRVTDGIGCFI